MSNLNDSFEAVRSRRAVIKAGFAVLGGGLVYGCVPAGTQTAGRPSTVSTQSPLARPVFQPPVAAPEPQVAAKPLAPKGVRPELFERAMAALDRHGSRVPRRDRIAIADFAAPSSLPRFHIVDVQSGAVTSLLVAHGSGSDPAHTGFLHRFSNAVGSNATCEGAFLCSDYYFGKHGHSQRLLGLDPTNSNAYDRAIVVHSAWYANPDMISSKGKLGRSQGCFAVGERDLDRVFAQLGQGRMIFAAKV